MTLVAALKLFFSAPLNFFIRFFIRNNQSNGSIANHEKLKTERQILKEKESSKNKSFKCFSVTLELFIILGDPWDPWN